MVPNQLLQEAQVGRLVVWLADAYRISCTPSPSLRGSKWSQQPTNVTPKSQEKRLAFPYKSTHKGGTCLGIRPLLSQEGLCWFLHHLHQPAHESLDFQALRGTDEFMTWPIPENICALSPATSTTFWISNASKGQEALAILGHPAQWDPNSQGDANPSNNLTQLAKGSINLYKHRYPMWPAEQIQSYPNIESTSCAKPPTESHVVSSSRLSFVALPTTAVANSATPALAL